ncbi:S1 family peptidase [Chthoniobacter flavus]|uniref:S1 family peptidase n=1 Tax=Chthoniobacter flavus TaxID=191863 RepID=UPI0014049B59|nr:trypsin-like serine protease [Chthoniobacter flavus]
MAIVAKARMQLFQGWIFFEHCFFRRTPAFSAMRKIMIWSALAFGAFFGFGPSNAFGIEIQSPGDGATDAEHIALAAQPEFQAGGWFSFTNSGTGETNWGSATLVTPDWVVTAAHNVLSPDGSTQLPLSRMKIGFGADALTDSTTYAVTQVIRPAGYSPLNYDSDLAFLKLATPVTGITPVGLYTGTLSAGQEVTAIGHGQPGSPATGFLPYDGIERGMVNQLGSQADFQSLFPDLAPGMVMTEFVGDNLSGNYEYFGGNLSLGDDGGGLMVLDNGVWKLAGVNVVGFDSSNYGDHAIYTEISAYSAWISSQSALASIVPEPGAFSLVVASAFAFLTRRTRPKKSRAGVKH